MHLSNILWGIIIFIPWNLDIKILWLIKKRKYFNYKKKKYIILNCLKKAKFFAIIDASNLNNIENINQKKE